jgi:hypothetical protein
MLGVNRCRHALALIFLRHSIYHDRPENVTANGTVGLDA